MRRLLILLCVAAFALLASGGSSAQPRSQDDAVIERPEWAIGDWWEFERGTKRWRLTVVAKRPDGYTVAESRANQRVESAAGRRAYLTDLDGWHTTNIDASGKTTPGPDKREWVKFPLKVGNRWFFHVMTTVAGSNSPDLHMYDYDCRAEGWETIDVGGRSVRAIKIGIAQRRRGGNYGAPLTAWYAPEAKRVVRIAGPYAGAPSLNMIASGIRTTDAPPVVATAPPVPKTTALDLTGPPGTAISIAGQHYRLGDDGTVSITLPPGNHELTATRDGYEPSRAMVVLDGRQERVSYAVNLTVRTPPPATAQATTPSPVIELNYPPADLRVDRDEIVVIGLVTAATGVARMQLSVNGAGVPVPGDGKMGPRAMPVRVTVKLQPGNNVVELTAADNAGNVAQLVRTVTRGAPGPLVAPASRLAVIIGIGEYDNRGIPTLRYAARDAEAIHQVLVTHGGFKKENVLLLTDRSAQRPTLRNIKSALGTFLARSARKEDTVLVFFAGHGAPEIDQRGLERDGLAKYLIPSDADPNDLYATALSMDEIQTIFGRIEAERIVVFIDSCYSGAAGGRTFASSRLRTRELAVDDLFLERLTRAKGRAIITASRPSEVSLELAELGHGLFTYYLVDGLKGAADGDRDGVVTLQELYSYVEQQVSRKSRAVGGNQHPVLKGELEGQLPLTSVKRR